MTEHLPVLQVVIPLLAAPVCALLGRGRHVWLFALVISLLCLLVSAGLLQQVRTGETLVYALGGWAAPLGIEYRVDRIGAFVLLIVSGIGSLVMLGARESVLQEVGPERENLFYTCYLLCLTGLLGIVITGDAFNLFVFLEISSLSSYALISFGRDRRALTSAFQYLVMGTIGATFILIGVGLLYMMTGTLNMADLAQRLPAVSGTRTILSAFAFLVVGITLKLALFPLHLWLPNAYTYAPSTVSAFLAATATKVGVYVLLRFVFTVFGTPFSFGETQLAGIFLVLSLAAIFSGSISAIFQHNLKRMLAFSSVAQIGYMILGISFATVTGLSAGILHLFNHALMKSALFLALGAVVFRAGSAHLSDMAGLGHRMPWTIGAFVIGGLSLIGVPGTVGFISKWYLMLAAIEKGLWPVAVLVLAGSLLAVIYVWRVVETAWFKPSPADSTVTEAPVSMLIPLWILVGANIWFGIDTRVTVDTARAAAATLLGTGS